MNDLVVVQTPMQEISNSIQPSIAEAERFILFLNNKFGLNLPNNLIVTIEGISHKTMGYYMAQNKIKGYTNTQQDLNTITLNSIHLKNDAYGTIAHEVAHFYNNANKIKDCTTNQYHNKYFMQVAQRLLLEVKKGVRGFAYTEPTPQFLTMLNNEFIPNTQAFHIAQYYTEKNKKPSRNLLYMCACGCKIRTAKNEEKPLKAVCSYCGQEFTQQ